MPAAHPRSNSAHRAAVQIVGRTISPPVRAVDLKADRTGQTSHEGAKDLYTTSSEQRVGGQASQGVRCAQHQRGWRRTRPKPSVLDPAEIMKRWFRLKRNEQGSTKKRRGSRGLYLDRRSGNIGGGWSTRPRAKTMIWLRENCGPSR